MLIYPFNTHNSDSYIVKSTSKSTQILQLHTIVYDKCSSSIACLSPAEFANFMAKHRASSSKAAGVRSEIRYAQ